MRDIDDDLHQPESALVAVALVSNREQRKGAWLLAAVMIVVVVIVDRIIRGGARPD
jgi:hypothetical protein